jgi:hypothetical protein
MQRTAARRTGALIRSIRQRAPGEIEVGVDYGPYVDRGTVHMGAQPFIRPTIRKIRCGFATAVGETAVGVLQR